MNKIQFIKVIIFFFILPFLVEANEYPLIESLSVTSNSITITPSKHFSVNYLREGDHTTVYYDSHIDLTQLDNSTLIMPFVFDVLGLIFISNETYYVEELDEELLKSLEIIKKVYKKMMPSVSWNGKLICKKTIKHKYNFSSSKTLTLFSGGVDSTYSALKNINKDQLLFVMKGHVDSCTEGQWQHASKIAENFGNLINSKVVFFFSEGRNLAIGNNEMYETYPSIYFWPTQGIGDLRWIGKAIPFMICNEISELCIPATITWSYPFPHASNPMIDDSVKFGNCIRVYTDGFDSSRIQKTSLIGKFHKDNFPITLKVCFDASGKNCNRCRKCIRTINDLYLNHLNPNLFGFNTSEIDTKKNLLQILKELPDVTRGHREMEYYFLNDQLLFIQQNRLYERSEYANWFVNTLKKDPRLNLFREHNPQFYVNLKEELK